MNVYEAIVSVLQEVRRLLTAKGMVEDRLLRCLGAREGTIRRGTQLRAFGRGEGRLAER